MKRNADCDDGLSSLFEFIKRMRGIDFSRYRRATVIRKLGMRLSETGAGSYGDYLSYLRKHPEELTEVINAFAINSSSFFRTPAVFDLLEWSILPDLAAEFGFLRVWCIGGAKGEEPYSVAILIHELLKRERHRVDASILSTDIDSEAVEKARRGLYSDDALMDVRKRHLDTFFERVRIPTGGTEVISEGYRIDDKIKARVTFVCADFIADLERSVTSGCFNLILCRNVLIYLERDLQRAILARLAELLPAHGCLVLGETESLPEPLAPVFDEICPGLRIYRKKRCSTSF